MENSNSYNELIFVPVENVPIVEPRKWNTKDLYQVYANYILVNNPQCWGKPKRGGGVKNYWIYKTVGSKVIEVMSYPRWKRIMTTFFKHARMRVIQFGEEMDMGRLGEIKIRRCERNFESKVVNFNETSKQKKVMGTDGKLHAEKVIYHTSEDYLRIGWYKRGQIKNERMYEFQPSAASSSGRLRAGTGQPGFKRELSVAVTSNPMLKFIYDYYPRREPKITDHDLPECTN